MRVPLLALLLALARPAHAAQEEVPGTFTLEFRVAASDRGWARIDRGRADGLRAGDVVTFLPREGGTYQGRVTELEERAARVEPTDPAFVPAPGTRGKVSLPRGRAGTVPRSRPRLRPAPKRQLDPSELPPPVFANRDEDWQEGEPLLAGVSAVRPAERAPSLHGRSYAILDATRATEGDRSDFFGRIGTGLVVENPFGHGERLHFDAEWNARRTDVDDLDDEEDVELRVDRLSYARGGDRFAPTGWEVGRFLQSGMVELGVLDGVEWSTRTSSGHRWGASIGFMPEPDQEYESGSDFQVAGFYRWVADESERAGAAIAYQKTFHDGAADRDLVVARVHRLPREGWSFAGTFWIDFYTDGDDAKDESLGLTEAYVAAGRRFEGGSSLDLVYTHREFPEIDRHEFLPVEDAQLADDHSERLGLTSGLQLTERARLRTLLGIWTDEDDDGGDAEVGLGLRDFVVEDGFAELATFGTRGSTVASVGVRASAGRFTAGGRWAFDYEFSQNRFDDFSAANDDLPQHRLRFSHDHQWNAWSVSWRLEALAYDDENALTFGLYLQRSHY